MRIPFFTQRPNTRYNYTPRYYKGKSERKPYEIRPMFERDRETYNQVDFGSQWQEARKESRTRSNRGVNKTLLIIITVLLLLFLWLIDFDFSIFAQKR